MLIDVVAHWSEFTLYIKIEAQQCALNWAQFKEKVMKKHFLQFLKDWKEVEFLQLKQGKLMLDYERKFEELFKYSSNLMDTKAKKAR